LKAVLRKIKNMPVNKAPMKYSLNGISAFPLSRITSLKRNAKLYLRRLDMITRMETKEM
jgi:hypothetical protein